MKTNFPFEHLDWLVMSKDIITVSGRELGDNVHAEVKTFSVVVSSDMAPGFHMIVHTATLDKEIVSDSLYVPVDAIKSHEIEFKTNQVKIYRMHFQSASSFIGVSSPALGQGPPEAIGGDHAAWRPRGGVHAGHNARVHVPSPGDHHHHQGQLAA